MNYLKEMNAFHIKQETNPLTLSATYLWFLLTDVNNKTGWRKNYSTSVFITCETTFPDTTFKRARLKLEKKGYIRFELRGRNRAAVYQMISLVNSEEVNGAISDRSNGYCSDCINDKSIDRM